MKGHDLKDAKKTHTKMLAKGTICLFLFLMCILSAFIKFFQWQPSMCNHLDFCIKMVTNQLHFFATKLLPNYP